MSNADKFGGLVFAQYNLKGISGTDFCTFLQIQSTQIYQKEGDYRTGNMTAHCVHNVYNVHNVHIHEYFLFLILYIFLEMKMVILCNKILTIYMSSFF
jgi:hypothetical protein